MIVNAPDGRKFNVPTNDPDVARKTVRQRLAQEWIVGNQSGKPGKTTGMDKAISALANGVTGGLVNVGAGGLVAGDAAIQNAWNKAQGKPTLPFGAGDAYRATREVQKEKAAGSPILNNVFGLLGGLKMPGMQQAGDFVAGKMASGSGGLLDNFLGSKALPMMAARSGLAAAPVGAITGAANAAPGHETEGAKSGALHGLAIGAALPLGVAGGAKLATAVTKPVIAGAQGAGRLLAKTAGMAPSDVQATATSELAKALRADGASADQIREIQTQWLESGASKPSLMDLASKLPSGGPATMRLLTGAAMRGGAAQKYATGVATNLQENASDIVRKLVPPGSKASATAIALKGAKRAEAAELYPEAHQTPVNEHMTPGATSALADSHGAAAIEAAANAAEADRDYAGAARLRALLPNAPAPAGPAAPTGPVAAPTPAGEPMNTPPPFTPPPVRGQDAIRAEQDAAGLAQAHRDIGAYAEPPTNSLFARIQKAGGISLKDDTFDLKDGVGDLIKQKRLPVGMFNENSPYDTLSMAGHLADQGMFGGSEKPPIDDFLAAFDKESRGTKVYHPDAVSPDWDQRNQAIEQELSDAGATASDSPSKRAQKLFEFRNGDVAEQRATQDEANAKDPAGLEFDRLAASKVAGPAATPMQPPAQPPILAGDLDRIQQAMGKRGAALMAGDQGTVAKGLFQRQSDLQDVLANVPQLGPARANFKANLAREKALELGQTTLETPSGAYSDQLDQLTGQATPDDNPYPISADDIRSAAQVGHVQKAVDSIERPAQGATGVLNTLTTSGRQIRNQNATFGENAASQMREGLGNELTRIRNARLIDPTLNSRTAGRADALASLDKSGGFFSLDPVKMTMGALAKVGQGLTLTPEERDAIVKAGLGSADDSGALNALHPDTKPILDNIDALAARYGVPAATAINLHYQSNPASPTGQ